MTIFILMDLSADCMPVVSTMKDYNNVHLVFSDKLTRSRGQEYRYRDRVRCMELQELGYNVFTVDDKHADLLNQFPRCRLLRAGMNCRQSTISHILPFIELLKISGIIFCRFAIWCSME